MTSTAHEARLADTPGLERVIETVKEKAASHHRRFGIRIVSVLAPNAAVTVGDSGDVNLLAEIVGDPDYFDIFEMEEELSARLGARVRIVVARALGEGRRRLVEAGMTPLT